MKVIRKNVEDGDNTMLFFYNTHMNNTPQLHPSSSSNPLIKFFLINNFQSNINWKFHIALVQAINPLPVVLCGYY